MQGGGSVLIGGVILTLTLPALLSQRGGSPAILAVGGLAVGGLAACISGAWYLVTRLGAGRDRVYACSDGLGVENAKGIRAHRWEEILQLHTEVHRGRWGETITHRLRFADGTGLLIDSRFARSEDLGVLVRACFESGLVKQYLGRIRAGEDLVMGPVRLGREGLTLQERQFIPYCKLRPVDTSTDSFYIHEKEHTLAHTAIDTRQVDSVPLLARLINDLIREAGD
jgi:hypothetical protein